MITKREAQRLVTSFLDDPCPPRLPEAFSFQVRGEGGVHSSIFVFDTFIHILLLNFVISSFNS